MTARNLRPVAPNEKPSPRARKKVHLSLAQAVEQGNYLEILKAQRREIASALPDERGPAKAALHRQMSMVSKEIQAIEEKRRLDAEKDPELSGDSDWDADAI